MATRTDVNVILCGRPAASQCCCRSPVDLRWLVAGSRLLTTLCDEQAEKMINLNDHHTRRPRALLKKMKRENEKKYNT